MNKIIPYDRNKPFNQLPLLPPDDEIIMTMPIMKKLIEANKSLAKLDGIASKLPNPNMLVNTISLQEAKASSEIENIFTTNDELYKAISTSTTNVNPATKEVLKYRQSLWSGVATIQNKTEIGLDTLIAVYQHIKETSLSIRSPHTLTVIKKRGNTQTSGQVIYTPPRGKGVIENKLQNMLEFINDDKKHDYDPLLKMAIAHYQIEAIHPFSDGNGRTGRILNLLILMNKGLLSQPILYLSKYIIENRDDYYANLGGVTQRRSWERWILYMLTAVEETAKFTIRKIEEISNQMNATLTYINQKLPHIDKELVETMFTQPYMRGEHILGPKIKSRNTASKYLHQLGEIGVLEPRKMGREIVFINNDLINILSGE
ncbi:MAG: Fic/DOC family N-terminal domain-containing protein [Bacteroidota bacterium]